MKLCRCAKIKYASKVDALIALKAMELRVGAGHSTYAPVRAYRCRRGCQRWHLTSQERAAC